MSITLAKFGLELSYVLNSVYTSEYNVDCRYLHNNDDNSEFRIVCGRSKKYDLKNRPDIR